MDDYLSKPIRAEALGNALARATAETERPDPVLGSDALHGSDASESDGEVLDPVALGQLREMAGDTSVLRELIDAFLQNAPGLLANLTGEDPVELRRAAHTLKSNAQTFGANDLAALCHELEQRAARGELAGTDELARRIEQRYERAAAALGLVRAAAD